nr:hypothetical protein CFP56_72406 [Quercus suber]
MNQTAKNDATEYYRHATLRAGIGSRDSMCTYLAQHLHDDMSEEREMRRALLAQDETGDDIIERISLQLLANAFHLPIIQDPLDHEPCTITSLPELNPSLSDCGRFRDHVVCRRVQGITAPLWDPSDSDYEVLALANASVNDFAGRCSLAV